VLGVLGVLSFPTVDTIWKLLTGTIDEHEDEDQDDSDYEYVGSGL